MAAHPLASIQSESHRGSCRPSPRESTDRAAGESRSKSLLRPTDVYGQYVVHMFKSIKQNLRIKTFVGTSANALKIQIWTALIALLLVRFLQLRSQVQWHTSRFIALLRRQLFVYRDLFRFLDHPFEGPLILRKDFLPDQNTLFTEEDIGQQGGPQLTAREKSLESRIIMRVPNPVPV